MNLKFQLSSTFNFFFSNKSSFKFSHPLKIYQHTKFNGPKLTSASCFASTSEVLKSAVLEWLYLQN
jgi:hypothetical protein